MSPDESPSEEQPLAVWLRRAEQLPSWALALAVFAGCFLVLRLCVGPPPIHEDTARDLAIARDCVDAGRCAMAGPTASFGRLTQGAGWIHLLEVSQALGIGLHGARTVVLALASVAATVLAFTPSRLCGWRAGPGAAALALAAMAYGTELPVLWNPSLLPLPLTLFYVALLALAKTGRTLPAVAAGAALALSVDAHVLCLVLVPFSLAAMVALAARPLRATLLAVGVLVATPVASSAGAVRADLPRLVAAWLPSLAAVVVALAAGTAARRRVQAARPEARSRGLLVAAAAYAVLALACASALTGHGLARRYLLPAAPPLALLAAGMAVGALAGRATSALRAAGSNAVLCVVVFALLGAARHAGEDARPSWTALDAEALAPALSGRGWTFGDLYRHLRGPQAHGLLAALGPFLPPSSSDAGSRERDDLLLLKTSPDVVRRLHLEERTLATLPGGAVALGRRAPSWFDAGSIEVCARSGVAEPRCLETGLGERDPDVDAAGTFTQRAYPELEGAHRTFFSDEVRMTGDVHWTMTLPLRPDASGPPRVLSLPGDHPRWRIERIDGLIVRGVLPSREVTLELEPGATRGAIEFAVDVPAAGAGAFRAWPPGWIETRLDEADLRALADEGGAP